MHFYLKSKRPSHSSASIWSFKLAGNVIHSPLRDLTEIHARFPKQAALCFSNFAADTAASTIVGLGK